MKDRKLGRHARRMQRMFARIARRYDLLNRLMTFGQDSSWRKEAVRHLCLHPDQWLLDVGTGTGELALEANRQVPQTRIIAVDFSPEMLSIARKRSAQGGPHWVIADALHLPFPNESFDGVVSGFLMRNVHAVDRALSEQRRVIRPQGRVVCLETSPPRENPMRPLIEFHLHRTIPFLGRLLVGKERAYRYLPLSTERFLDAQAFAERMQIAGFEQIGFVRRMLGTVAIHWARRSV